MVDRIKSTLAVIFHRGLVVVESVTAWFNFSYM